MSIETKLTNLVEQQFPGFFRTDAPKLVAFIKAYYEYLEQTGQVEEVTKNLLAYRSIDDTLDKFIKYFHDEFLHQIPENTLADKRLLVKHITDMYRAKGAEKATALLFRILYNEEIIFQYPGELMLRASDGKWSKPIILKVSGDDTNFLMEGFLITGGSSGATGLVENVQKVIEAGATVYNLELSNELGTFIQRETITSTNGISAIINTSGVTTATGRWIGTDGFLSWDKVLQDSVFYQEYSYVVHSQQYINRYRDILKKLVHPAGVALFGQIAFVDILSTTVATVEDEIVIQLSANNTTIADSVGASSFIRIDPNEIIEASANNIAILQENPIFEWRLGYTNGVQNVVNNQIAFVASRPLSDLASVVLDAIPNNRLIMGQANVTFNSSSWTAWPNQALLSDINQLIYTNGVQNVVNNQIAFVASRPLSDLASVVLDAIPNNRLIMGQANVTFNSSSWTAGNSSPTLSNNQIIFIRDTSGTNADQMFQISAVSSNEFFELKTSYVGDLKGAGNEFKGDLYDSSWTAGDGAPTLSNNQIIFIRDTSGTNADQMFQISAVSSNEFFELKTSYVGDLKGAGNEFKGDLYEYSSDI